MVLFLPIVKVMAHPLAGANVDRGVKVEMGWKHGKQRGYWWLPCTASLSPFGIAPEKNAKPMMNPGMKR
jgi:hypothetical protein